MGIPSARGSRMPRSTGRGTKKVGKSDAGGVGFGVGLSTGGRVAAARLSTRARDLCVEKWGVKSGDGPPLWLLLRPISKNALTVSWQK